MICRMDALDRRILAELQRNGRVSNVELARAVGLSPSPCLRRLRRLEDEGIIRGYSAVLDRPAVGLGLTVFIDLRVEPHSEQTAAGLEKAVGELSEVVACHMVSGSADFHLEVVVSDLAHYERLLMQSLLALPAVTDVRSSFAIRCMKADGPLPLRAPPAPRRRQRYPG